MTMLWKSALLLAQLVVISRRPNYAKELGLPEVSREPTSQFSLRDEALARLGPHEIVERHDDGDLTIRNDTTLYVVTTDGKVFRLLANGATIEMATAETVNPEREPSTVKRTASERKPQPSIYQGTSQLSAAGKACIPCGNDHFSTVAGQLGESMRFAREGDITHPEVLSRIAHAEDELNAFEREDGASEKVAKLPPAEKAIMDEMLVASRKLRHALSDIKDVAGLEKAAAEAQQVRVAFRAKLFGLQLQRLSPEQVKRIAERMAQQSKGVV